jgi:hypothetical protein
MTLGMKFELVELDQKWRVNLDVSVNFFYFVSSTNKEEIKHWEFIYIDEYQLDTFIIKGHLHL